MNRSEKLALFLGMLSGDGCLSIKHNGEGYRNYPIQFFNNREEIVQLFATLFYDLFGIAGRVTSRQRPNRQRIWEFLRYSVATVSYLKGLGFPEGVKRDILRIPQIIWTGSNEEKRLFFSGFAMTDGCLRKDGRITFHIGSKLFLEDLSLLCSHFIHTLKPVKEFQQGQYTSYQLYLNKDEGELVLCPDATMVLGRS